MRKSALPLPTARAHRPMNLQFDRYYRYTEFTDILHQFAREFPGLISLESVGKSHEGRDIWVVTATNTATGPAADKPAYWVDANIHASELAGGAAALIGTLSPAQMMKIATGNTLLCRFRMDDDLVWNLLTSHGKGAANDGVARLHASILMAGRHQEAA